MFSSGHFCSFESLVFVFSLVNIESVDFVENTNIRDYTKSIVSLFLLFRQYPTKCICLYGVRCSLTRNKYYFFSDLILSLSFRQTIDPLRWLTLFMIDFLSFDRFSKVSECFSFFLYRNRFGSLILLEYCEDAQNDICMTIFIKKSLSTYFRRKIGMVSSMYSLSSMYNISSMDSFVHR